MPLRDRYPDQDVLAQRGHWDDATRRVVLDRVHNVPRFRFFDDHQRDALEALCELVMPQAHRPPNRRIPIAPWIDDRCYYDKTDGFRFDDMPATPVAWRWGLEGLDQAAEAERGSNFSSVALADGDRVVQAILGDDPPGAIWKVMSPRKWWSFVAVRQITGVYYAHPYAWDEIGFGGPAYPRGYFALNFGAPEPWEAEEVAGPEPNGPSNGTAQRDSGRSERHW